MSSTSFSSKSSSKLIFQRLENCGRALALQTTTPPTIYNFDECLCLSVVLLFVDKHNQIPIFRPKKTTMTNLLFLYSILLCLHLSNATDDALIKFNEWFNEKNQIDDIKVRHF
jgi:hypothetical protein